MKELYNQLKTHRLNSYENIRAFEEFIGSLNTEEKELLIKW